MLRFGVLCGRPVSQSGLWGAYPHPPHPQVNLLHLVALRPDATTPLYAATSPVHEVIFPLPGNSLPFPQAREGAWELDFLLLRRILSLLIQKDSLIR